MTTARMLYEKSVLTLGYGIVALFCAALPLVLLSSARIVPTVILGVIYCAYVRRFNGDSVWPIRKLWIAFWIVLLFVRIDISVINWPGPPRIVRYVIGLPSRQLVQKAQRGEVVLHGCVATGLEPFWIWVW